MKRRTLGIVLPQQFIGTRTFLPFLVIAKTRELKLLAALFILLINAFNSTAQTMSFTALTNDYSRQFAGSYRWNENSGTQIASGVPTPMGYYRRFSWTDIEHTTQGNYLWTKFDDRVKEAINAGQKFSFGIMQSFPGGDGIFNRLETYSGTDQRTGSSMSATSAYPQYLHNLMQAEGTKDWVGTSTDWVPNYNSTNFKSRLNALYAAITAHINATSYTATAGPHIGQVVQFRDVIEYVDIRGVGSYGEWHHNASIPEWPTQAVNYFPSGTFPTVQSFKDIIDAHVDNFPDWQLVIIFNVFDHMVFVNTQVPNEVAVYALQQSNNYGPIGFRDDHIGDYMSYNDQIMKDNNEIYDAAPNPDILMKHVIQERWKQAPLMGEPPGYQNTGSCGTHMCSLAAQLVNYHYSYVGNGNYGMNPVTNAVRDIMQARFKEMGHILRLTGGSVSLTSNFTINVDWRNYGNAPSYDRWDVKFQLRTSGGTVVWTGDSDFDPYLFLPAGSSQAEQDVFTMPNIAAGNYNLYMICKDPRNEYMQPLALGITGRQSDGSYLLLSNISFTGGTNQAPVANAGTDKSIQLPTSSTIVTGSGTDADGTIASYAWTQVSGPSTASISSPTSATTNITGLVQGSYTFRLTVTDNLGATGTDDVVVTVSAVSGGPVYLTWETPIDSDYEQFNTSKGIRKLSSSPWSTNSGIVTAMQSMEPGDELFAQLYLSTNTWAIGLSVNKPLTYVYGDPTGNSAAVFGYVVAIDANKFQAYQAGAGIGTQKVMANFEWVKIVYSSSQQIIYQTATASTGPWTTLYTSSVAPSGPYHITFHGIGNGAGPNEIYIVKASGTNQSPTANAGTDKSIQLPTNSVSVTGSGSDADGTIATYAWTKVSGGAATIASPSSATTNITGLVQGSYTFRLTVTDNQGATGTDDVIVTVAAANVAPMANAGTDKSIQLPTNSVSVTGSGSDADGTIATYAWTKVSGGAATIASPSSATTNITGLVQGSYTFRLTVTDNQGATGTDDVIVTVAAANVAPTANAGTDKSIQLPTNSVSVTGSGSDADGTIVSYAWTKVSGGAATIASPSSATTNITGLVQGSYTFRLTVTDNQGATGTDDVIVTVAAANVAPTANAGTDKSIQLPTNSVSVTGSGSDADGTIATYAWTKVSGGAATITSPSSATTNITGLVQGSYTFRLTVTDNQGATGTDDVVVTVAASSNPVYLTWVTPIDSDYEQFNSNKGIRKLSSSSWSTSSGTVKAIQTMDPGDELIAQLYLASNSWAIGLTTSSSISYVYDDPNGNSNCPFGYVVAIDGTNIQAYQAGAGVGTQRSMTNFYWVKIAYSASNQNIVYSTASSSTGTWTTLYTSATVPSGSYNIFFQGIGNGAGPNEIYINKGTVARPGPGKPTVGAPSLEPAGVNLVPNPVSSTLKININSAVPVGKSTVRIYSQNGQLVYKEQFVRSQQKLTKEVDVSKYTGGIYYVYVNEGEKKGVILRFLKN